MTERQSNIIKLGLLGVVLPIVLLLPLSCPSPAFYFIINRLWEMRYKIPEYISLPGACIVKLGFIAIEYGMYRFIFTKDKGYARSYMVGAITGSGIAYGWDVFMIIRIFFFNGGPG